MENPSLSFLKQQKLTNNLIRCQCLKTNHSYIVSNNFSENDSPSHINGTVIWHIEPWHPICQQPLLHILTIGRSLSFWKASSVNCLVPIMYELQNTCTTWMAFAFEESNYPRTNEALTIRHWLLVLPCESVIRQTSWWVMQGVPKVLQINAWDVSFTKTGYNSLEKMIARTKPTVFLNWF